MPRITNVLLSVFVCASSLNTFAQPKGLDSFFERVDPDFEITSLLNAFQQQSAPQVATLDSIVLVPSVGDHYVILHHDYNSLSQLSPTIGQFISDLNEIGDAGIDSIPLPVSSQSLELLLQGMQGAGNLELAIQLLQSGYTTEAALAKLEDDARYLDSGFLLDVINLAKRECERYFGPNKQASESEEEFSNSEGTSSSEDEVPTFEELFPDGMNTCVKQEHLKSLDPLWFKGKELQQFVCIVHHIFVRHSQIAYMHEHPGKLDVLGLILSDKKNSLFPYDPNRLSELAKQFLIHFRDPHQYMNDFLFHEYRKENSGANDQLLVMLANNIEGEVCHFEGLLGEIFCKDEQVKQILSYLTKSFENQLNAQKEIRKLISSKKHSNAQIMSFLGTKDMKTANHRIYLIDGAIQQLEIFVRTFDVIYPNLMSLYLLSQYFTTELDWVVGFMETKPSSKMSSSRCNDQKEFALLRARYFGLEAYETALQIMKPYVDQFLQIVGEGPSVLPVMHEELKKSARFHAALVETATKELKNVPKPKQKQITTSKKKEDPVHKSVMPAKAKRPEPKNQHLEPVKVEITSALIEPPVTTSAGKTTVKPEKRESKKREEKRDHKKTEEERAQKRAMKKQKIMDEYRAEREKREKERALFRVVLSSAEAELVISGLSKNHHTILEYVFAQPSAHLILTDKHITLLAKGIQKQMNLVLGKESTTFMDAIEERIHYAHDSKDSGDKLPGHYVDILRTVFIIFGVIPEGWEPKTREDRAIAKKL